MATSTNVTEKRDDAISWNDYFMALALVARERSKDPHFQVGACLVSTENQILGIGYNGFPTIKDNDDKFFWGKYADSKNKHLYVVHAEVNAICHSNVPSLKGCKMYVTHFPCNECAKVIIQIGITEVVYLSDEKKDPSNLKYEASEVMLTAKGVTCGQFKPDREQIKLNLTPPTKSSLI